MADHAGTLDPWINRYLTEQRRIGRMNRDTSRKAGYRLQRLSDTFGRRPLNQFSRRSIEHWLSDIDHLAPGTRRLNLATAATFCRWLVYEGAIRRDPTIGVSVRKPRTVPRALSRAQLGRLVPSLPDDRAELIVAMMLHVGLRACEVSRANVDDYDPRSATILVTGKGGHQRLLPVPAEAVEVVDRYLTAHGVTAGPLVRSRNHPWQALTPGTISTLLSRWMAASGIKKRPFDGVSGHALRHTAASDTLERCHDLEVVREMLGHVSLTTTQVYLRRADVGRLRQGMEGRSYLRVAK